MRLLRTLYWLLFNAVVVPLRCARGHHVPYKRLWRPIDESVPLTAENAEWHVYCVHCDGYWDRHVFNPEDPDGVAVPLSTTQPSLRRSTSSSSSDVP